MSCAAYQELQRRCESKRKEMSHFMRYKPMGWQADPTARNFARETQAAILRVTAEINKHEDNCPICNPSTGVIGSRNTSAGM